MTTLSNNWMPVDIVWAPKVHSSRFTATPPPPSV